MKQRFTEKTDLTIIPKFPIPHKYWCVNAQGDVAEYYFKFYVINEWGTIHYKSKTKRVVPEWAIFSKKQEAIDFKNSINTPSGHRGDEG